MNNIKTSINRYLLFYFILISSIGCSYKLSNNRINVPANNKSIAIEGIYNTGDTVIPHELLWTSLQKHFALSGKFILRSKEDADLYLKARITDSSMEQYGSDFNLKSIKNPNAIFNSGSDRPASPNKIKNINTAKTYPKNQRIEFLLKIEIWDLHSKKRIFFKEYPLSKTFNLLVHPATSETSYLRHEEHLNYTFKYMAESVAKDIVNDLLYKYISHKSNY